ncbi:C1QL [Mytilus coruscus]|uniref:C1QL n=1 Tax=Mytilus coruscus TaxID=42192 RepID=A0A6J8DQX7_MYTCO|nr:C1QL [Mytilus coruscus]
MKDEKVRLNVNKDRDYIICLCYVYCENYGVDLECRKALKNIKYDIEYLTHAVNLQRQAQQPERRSAFYAIMSRSFNHSEIEAVLQFDNVTLNIGNNYDRFDGVYTAPVYGTYLFSWKITAGYASSVNTALMVNSKQVASMHTDSGESPHQGFQASSSNTAIITVQLGDQVYVRNTPQRGQILSNLVEQSGFAGTLLFQP